jgi:hypothetical protein
MLPVCISAWEGCLIGDRHSKRTLPRAATFRDIVPGPCSLIRVSTSSDIRHDDRTTHYLIGEACGTSRKLSLQIHHRDRDHHLSVYHIALHSLSCSNLCERGVCVLEKHLKVGVEPCACLGSRLKGRLLSTGSVVARGGGVRSTVRLAMLASSCV